MMEMLRVVLPALALLPAVASYTNIVVLLANNVRTDDLSCYNPNSPVRTPNIDRLAEEGVLLGHHTVPALTLTGNRAAHVTAKMPLRYGLQESKDGVRRILHTLSGAGLPDEVVTYADLLSEAGYRTMAAGSWELGWGCTSWKDACHSPLEHGFDSFHGIPLSLPPPEDQIRSDQISEQEALTLFLNTRNNQTQYDSVFQSIAETTWYTWLARLAISEGSLEEKARLSEELQKQLDYILVSGDAVSSWPYSLQGITLPILTESLQFIRNSHQADKPFLLQQSFLQVHRPSVTPPHRVGSSQVNAYYDGVLELDWWVGRIVRQLEELDILDNTLIYFSSDHNDLIDLPDAETTDNKVPGIFMLKNILPPYVIERPTSILDVFPTIVDISGEGQNLLPLTLDGASLFFALVTKGTPRLKPQMTYRGDVPESATLILPNNGENVLKLYLDESCLLCKEASILYNLTSDPYQLRPVDDEEILEAAIDEVRENTDVVPAVASQLANFWKVMPLPELYPWAQEVRYQAGVNVSSAEDLLSFLEADVVVAAESEPGSGAVQFRVDSEDLDTLFDDFLFE